MGPPLLPDAIPWWELRLRRSGGQDSAPTPTPRPVLAQVNPGYQEGRAVDTLKPRVTAKAEIPCCSVSVPDPLGRDRLAAGAASYKPPVYGEKPPAKPFFLRRWAIVALVATAFVASTVIYRGLHSAEDSPEAAATRVIELFLDQDYRQMRSKLCREDRARVGTNDLESAGLSAGNLLKALREPVIDSVTPVTLAAGYAGVEARQVSGRIIGLSSTSFQVVTVKEQGGWRVCLSPGGYALAALNLEVPLGGVLTGPT